MAGDAILSLSEVSKRFGPVVALRDGRLDLHAGSIQALVGENGAGKSTLVKIIAGLYQRDTGSFTLDGKEVAFRSTADSKAAGIAVIYQEPTLFPDLSVTENVFMGRQPTGRLGRIDRGAMRAEVEALMTRLGVQIDPDRPWSPTPGLNRDHRTPPAIPTSGHPLASRTTVGQSPSVVGSRKSATAEP